MYKTALNSWAWGSIAWMVCAFIFIPIFSVVSFICGVLALVWLVIWIDRAPYIPINITKKRPSDGHE